MLWPILFIYLNDNEKDVVRTLIKEMSQRDKWLRVFALADVGNNRRHPKLPTFTKGFTKRLGDHNRIFFYSVKRNRKSGG